MVDKIIDDLSFKLLVSLIEQVTKNLKEMNMLVKQMNEEHKILHKRIVNLEARVFTKEHTKK